MDSPLFPRVDLGLIIQKIDPANARTSRGQRTFEMMVPGVVQCTTYFRTAGEEFGAHFHTGEDPSKNPEIFQLLFGKMEFHAKDKYGNERTIELDTTDGVPILMFIEPYILHFARAITDVIFIELRKTPFDPIHPDTYPLEEF
jgi:oxalate decarboxylase/phosphoglucose isomerase-like protein (cupin superfamily)